VNTGPIESTASFGVPYNYEIQPQITFFPANADRIQVGGTELGWSASLRIEPRLNELVQETYSTATRPDTRWSVVEFYVNANRTTNPNENMNLTPDSLTTNPCSFFTYDNGIQNVPQGCTHTSGMGQLNVQSGTTQFNLMNGSTFNIGMSNRTIADAPIGTKFCVSVAVMDRDSTHNEGFGQVSGGLWRLTEPECVVVGKMPMVNILGNGLYSDGSIEGVTFDKRPAGQTEFGAFGSWAEYEIVSAGAVRNIASGAALGAGAGGVPVGGFTTTTMVPRSVLVGSCSIATLTFRNAGCQPLGGLATALGQMAGASNLQAFGRARDIRHRYTGRNDATTISGNVSLSGYSERMNYLKSNGNLTINASTIGRGRTVVVESTGTVTIAGNITLDDGPYTDISQIPQVLIFAPNINIEASVTRIDAWLLAGLNTGSGTVNTCASVTSVSQLDGNTCTNQLRVNGPVMASRVLLHRTHGAGMGMPDSARPAEVFLLSPATYLWTHHQSEVLRQAFLTYAREVAPRF
jgi:hypothetical protein